MKRVVRGVVRRIDDVLHRHGLVIGPGKYVCDLHDALASGRRYRDVRRERTTSTVWSSRFGSIRVVDPTDVTEVRR